MELAFSFRGKKKIPIEYFDWQKAFFIKNKELDIDYAEYLESKTSWMMI